MAAASEGEALAAASRPDGTPAERALAAAAERAVLLLRFAESLAAAGGVDEVCATIVEQCRDGLGAAGAGVALYDVPDQVLRTVSRQGYPPEVLSNWERLPLAVTSPMTVAVRDRRPVFYADLESWAEEFPDDPLLQVEYAARCALPMFDAASSEPVGVVVMSWRDEQTFDDAERTLLRTVVALCAQSLTRAIAREEQERRRFASAVDAMLDPVGVYSAVRDDTGAVVDFRIVYLNQAALPDASRGRPEDMVGRTLRELFPYLERTGRVADYARVAESREARFLEGVRAGTPEAERVFDIQVAPFQDGIIIVTRDVTDRYTTAADLALSEARLNAAQRVGRIGSWETSEDGRTVWSDELYRMFGTDPAERLAPDEVMKRSIPLDQRMRLRALVADMWSTGSALSTEYPVLTQEGDRRWFSARAELQAAPTGGSIVRGVVQDITEQRELQRALSTLAADLRDERAAAEVLQRALLPQELPRPVHARVHAVYEPAGQDAHAGGDWYDAFVLPGGQLAFTVGDVAGHGLAAAATMSELRHALRAFASLSSSPGEVVTRLATMFAEWSYEPYATCLYAVYDPERSVIEFANAGHLPMLVRGAGADVETRFVQTQPGPPLGAAPYVYVSETVEVSAGELLLLYTDGLVERRGESIDVGLHRLEDALVALDGLPARDVCERLVLGARGGDRPDDDVCVLAVEVGLADGSDDAAQV